MSKPRIRARRAADGAGSRRAAGRGGGVREGEPVPARPCAVR